MWGESGAAIGDFQRVLDLVQSQCVLCDPKFLHFRNVLISIKPESRLLSVAKAFGHGVKWNRNSINPITALCVTVR